MSKVMLSRGQYNVYNDYDENEHNDDNENLRREVTQSRGEDNVDND